MVGVGAGASRRAALHARDVAGDVDLEPLEQRPEGAVEVKAIAAAPADHAVDGRERLDPRRLAAIDVDVLVRDPRHVRAREGSERRGVDLALCRIDPEELEVRRSGAIR